MNVAWTEPCTVDQYFTALPNYKAKYNYNRETDTSTWELNITKMVTRRGRGQTANVASDGVSRMVPVYWDHIVDSRLGHGYLKTFPCIVRYCVVKSSALPPMAQRNVESGGFIRTERYDHRVKNLVWKSEGKTLGIDGRKILKWIIRNGLTHVWDAWLVPVNLEIEWRWGLLDQLSTRTPLYGVSY